MIFAGDFAQLPPVIGHEHAALYSRTVGKNAVSLPNEEAVRGHFRVPTSPTEYLRPKAVNTFHLSDTLYIPPHRRRLYNPYPNSSPSQPPSAS